MGEGAGARGYLPCLCCLQTLPLPPPHPFLQTWSLVSDGSRQETSLQMKSPSPLSIHNSFFSNSVSDSEKLLLVLVVLLNFNSYQTHSKHKERWGGKKDEERKMKRDGLRDRDREIHRGSRRLIHLDRWPS